jgi:NADH:ubiquinone oxidoreductase subunit 3 (subunit A)
MNTFLGSPLVMLVIITTIFLYPVARILKRTGHSGWWALLVFLPLVNLAALWVFAFARWPALGNAQTN